MGASACVPTCGLMVIVLTFTLAPSDMSQAQPQENGVSPGHSGVVGETATEMSISGMRESSSSYK